MTLTAPDVVHFPNGLELTELDQLHRHQDPATGGRPVGDCYRTALACLLGAPTPTVVPHFVDQVEDLDTTIPLGWETFRLTRRWLRSELELDLFPADIAWAAKTGRPYMASVQSKAGPWGHVVVAEGYRVIHDPSRRRIAELRATPYTFADVLDYEGSADLLVTPYSPGPDAQLVAWALDEHRRRLDTPESAWT